MRAQDILKDLVAINTIEDKDNRAFMDYLESFFKPLGFSVQRLTNEKNGAQVLIAQYGEAPAIGFLGHSDTVDITDGWVTDPHVLTEKDGMLYGLGSCDMKGGLAAAMAAIADTDFSALKRGIAFYCTYDEELMFGGIEDLMAAGLPMAEHIVVAEPTEDSPLSGSKGLLEYVLDFTGITTHSSTPIDGKNSNKNAVRFLNKMLDFELSLRAEQDPFYSVPYTTMNVGLIRGGQAMNKVADHTQVYMDFRINDSPAQYERIRAFVDEAIAGLDGSYEIINDIPSFRCRSPLLQEYEALTGKKTEAFPGITEASWLKGDCLILGPGPGTAHQANEHVSVASLEKITEIYGKMIRRLCK